MKREKFLRELEKGLVNFSDNEIKDIVFFYEELFDEEGIGKEDEVPEQYIVKKIIKDLTLNQKIQEWEDEGKSLSKLRKSIQIIALSILSIPSIVILGIIFMVLLLMAFVFTLGAYGTGIYIVFSTITNMTNFSKVTIFDILLLLGLIILVLGITMVIIELLTKLSGFIIKKIRRK